MANIKLNKKLYEAKGARDIINTSFSEVALVLSWFYQIKQCKDVKTKSYSNHT